MIVYDKIINWIVRGNEIQKMYLGIEGHMKTKRIVFLISLWIGIFLFSASSYAAEDVAGEKTRVKVGVYEREGFFENNGTSYSGFGVDYLNSIAAYAGWIYEYVEGTREECLEWLKTGKIDLLFPVHNDESFESAKISSKILGEDFCYIYKLDNNFDITYKDYEKFGKCTVGVVAGNDLQKRIEEYCEKNDFSFYNILTYATLKEAENDLAVGKIDLLAADAYVNITNMKVVDRFVSGLATIAVSDESLLRQLDIALDMIKLDNPGYTEELRGRYFAEGSQKNLEYSEEELGFLSEKHTYKAALCKNQYPISFSTEDKGYKGIALEIISIIEQRTGFTVEYEYVDDFEEAEKMLQEGKVDFLVGAVLDKQVMNDFNLISQNAESARMREYMTDFFEVDMAFVGKKETDLSMMLAVAYPAYMERGISFFKEMYPQYEFVQYKDNNACFEAVVKNEVQLAMQPDTKVNEMSNYNKYREVRNLKNIPANFVVTFVIHTGDNVLIKVLDKTLDGLTEATLSGIESNNVAYVEEQGMTIKEFLDRYLADIIVFLVVAISVGLGLYMYRKFKKEQRSKETAYKDAIARISSMEKFRLDVEPILRAVDKDMYYVIATDLDKFQVINDLYGYENGDKMIIFLAGKFKQSLGPDEFITRSMADNFIILKRGENISQIEDYLEQVFQDIDESMAQYSSYFHVILKAGIYHVEKEDYILSSIIDKANLAKANMKRSHKSSYALYDDTMRRKNIEDKEVENDMEEALRTKQFQVYLQPQIDLRTKKIVSAEALVRWCHPKKGMIPPFRFVPVFENNGFITRLDIFVWEEVMKTIVKWQKNGKIMVPIAINLSRVDMEREDIVEVLTGLIEKYGLDPSWIKAELTESVCLENDSLLMQRMEQLKRCGFKIAVDDFGSGYSSLHLLKSMPLDILKIDKAFLDINMNMTRKDEIVIRDVVEMGKHLEVQSIMEGVETKAQSDFLEAIGCDIAQGYFYGKPMPIPEFEKVLEENHRQETEKL